MLIKSAFPFSSPFNFFLFNQSIKQPGCLKWSNFAQIHHVRSLNGTVRFDEFDHHLFLLDRVEPGLSDIGGLLIGFLKHSDTLKCA